MVGVAQLVEHRVVIPVVAGSSPVTHPSRTAGRRHDASGLRRAGPRSWHPAAREVRMGFLSREAPVVDYATWSQGTRSEKIRPMARHWAEVGFGTPVALHLFYVAKILLYVLGGWSIAVGTAGIDGFTAVGDWYAEPIVFQKVVLYTMLFEVVGLGCGFGPLNNRLVPPMGSVLYWLRPGTIRLPPWPGRVPFTRGDTRTPFDVLLYAALLVALLVALFPDGTGPM